MHELEPVERTVFAIEHLAGHGISDEARARFLLDQILDSVECTYFALFQIREEGSWIEVVSSGSVEATIPFVADWQKLNRDVLCHHRPTQTDLAAGLSLTSMRLTVEGTDYVIHGVHGQAADALVENLMALVGRLFLLFKGRRAASDAVDSLGVSARQRQILELMADGLTYGAIARQLGFSESLIKQEAMRICERLGVDSRFEAAAWMREQRVH